MGGFRGAFFLSHSAYSKMQLTLINYVDKDYQRYKDACTFNHKECVKINELKTIEQIKACQVCCQYSYDSQPQS